MRVSFLVQAAVGNLHIRADPGPGLDCPGLSAQSNHAAEILIQGNLILLLAYQLAQTTGGSQLCRSQYHAGVRRPPQNRLTFFIPGENPLRIRPEQPLGAQITADRKQTIGLP